MIEETTPAPTFLTGIAPPSPFYRHKKREPKLSFLDCFTTM